MNVLEQLRARFEELRGQLTALAERAQNENRPYTEAETANEGMLRTELTTVHQRIEAQVAIERSIAATQELLGSAPKPASTPTPVQPHGTFGSPVTRVVERAGDPEQDALVRSLWPTPGDYIADIIHAENGDAMARERLQRAIAAEVTGDVPGLVPLPIVGDIINIIDASRPTVASMRAYPMPQYGASFTRPKVSQNTQVGPQSAEKAELASRKFTVTSLNVSKVTYGGSLNVSFQTIDWTNPSALNAITDDLADQYAIQTEGVACGSLFNAASVTNVANKIALPAAPTGSDLMKALYGGAAKVYAGGKSLPDTIYASVDVWAWLGSLVDTSGRPMFPTLSPMNAAGTQNATSFTANPAGMSLVVSPGFAAKTLVIGSSKYSECYEDRRGALRIIEPRLLGWEIAYYGYFTPLITEPKAFVWVDATLVTMPADFAAGELGPQDDDEADAKPVAGTAKKA